MKRPPTVPSATFGGLIKLARHREYVPFVFLTTLVGVKLADAPLDWRLPVVLAANFMTVCFAFMVNDIEDLGLPPGLHNYSNASDSIHLMHRAASTDSSNVHCTQFHLTTDY